MASETPPFWWTEPDWRAAALAPLALLYGAVAGHRLRNARRTKVDIPVLCIGNFTVGGSGKTPVAIAFAHAARAMGLSPGMLSRGHGGSVSKPHMVDLHHDSAREVGDEPLLLAAAAPVVVSRDRAAGAKLLIEQGCDLLIMDDGFQSAQIHIDYALLVVDGRYGLGNGRVIPAGPLRAGLVEQMRFAAALLVMGEGAGADSVIRAASRAGRPVFRAGVRARQDLTGLHCVAFAGIGHPQKFFDTLRGAGATLVSSKAFPDHYSFGDDELKELAGMAEAEGAELVTTAKDAVRIGPKAFHALLPGRTRVLDIEAVFDAAGTPSRIVNETLAAWSERRLKA